MKDTILVVEDEAIIADDIQATLAALGYDVPRTAATSAEAIALAEELRPALALMDIKIRGDVDGVDTARALRERFDVPVVYLTSHSDEATLNRAKATHPYGYILKPFTDRELRTAIEVAIHKHRLEAQLAARERWFSTTLRSIGDAVVATDPEQRITFMNGVAERITGWTLAEAAGRKLSEVMRLVRESNGAPVESPMVRALGEGFVVELPRGTALLARHGGSVSVDDSAAPIVDDAGRLLGGVLVFRDVTDRVRLERRLAQAERLASVGTLASGAAHEINNPLASVVANLDFTKEALAALERAASDRARARAEQDAREAIEEARQAAARIQRIVADLGRLARTDQAPRTPLEIAEVVEAAIELVQREPRPPRPITRQYGTTPFVLADEGQLVQVFAAIVRNAFDAVSDDGHVRVATFSDEHRRAVVEVRDDGVGIPPDALPRIFDPFYTRKPLGKGMGLGLSVAHGVVTQLGGEIAVRSEVGRGTSVRVLLPGARAASSRPSTRTSA